MSFAHSTGTPVEVKFPPLLVALGMLFEVTVQLLDTLPGAGALIPVVFHVKLEFASQPPEGFGRDWLVMFGGRLGSCGVV